MYPSAFTDAEADGEDGTRDDGDGAGGSVSGSEVNGETEVEKKKLFCALFGIGC
jgi:hypothetical protein